MEGNHRGMDERKKRRKEEVRKRDERGDLVRKIKEEE